MSIQPLYDGLTIFPPLKYSGNFSAGIGLITAVHAAMYPPGIRRGDLQNALAVLARYRVATLQWPMELDRKITSPFGLRIDPIKHKKSRHTGIDISAPVNHPVSSVHRGYIQHISRDSVSGIWLRVNHGFGIFSTFCHLNSINVRKSDWVRQKQVVAKSGNTGRSTGPHLHYSLMINNGLVNPMKYGFSPRNIRR
jgi:murein DD-endopeptidase MepM/ murein hydrolase activator NlpD